jgi:hypothetical protein
VSVHKRAGRAGTRQAIRDTLRFFEVTRPTYSYTLPMTTAAALMTAARAGEAELTAAQAAIQRTSGVEDGPRT